MYRLNRIRTEFPDKACALVTFDFNIVDLKLMLSKQKRDFDIIQESLGKIENNISFSNIFSYH